MLSGEMGAQPIGRMRAKLGKVLKLSQAVGGMGIKLVGHSVINLVFKFKL